MSRTLGKRKLTLDERFSKLARGMPVASRSANAANIIMRVPGLRGYARTGGKYTGRYARQYGRDGPEVKFFDTTHSFTCDTTGEVPATGQLNLIPQGITESTRVGRKITIKSINMRLLVQPNTTVWIGSIVRLMLVQDTQCNGDAATYSGQDGVLETDTVQAFRNLENTHRFIVHKDWYFPLTPKAGVVGAFNVEARTLTFNKKCHIPIDFDSSATTGVLDTIRSNNLFLLARSSMDDDIVQVQGVTRLRYTDN